MIPQNKIDFLKRALPVPELFRLLSFNLKRAGRQFVVLCPFHQEKTPSCILYEDHYHCYGCKAHGNVIQAYIRIKRSDFRTALEDLGRMAGISHNLAPRSSGRSVRINIPRREME